MNISDTDRDNNEKEIYSAENDNIAEIDNTNIDGDTSDKGEDLNIIVDNSNQKEDLKIERGET